jgi:hypothetical protein
MNKISKNFIQLSKFMKKIMKIFSKNNESLFETHDQLLKINKKNEKS